MLSLLSIIGLIGSGFLLIRAFKITKVYETVMLLFLFSTTQIIMIGFVLSAFNYLNRINYWATANLVCLGITLTFVLSKAELRQKCFHRIEIPSFNYIKLWYIHLTLMEKLTIIPTLFVSSIITIVNLLIVIFFPTKNFDSLAYILPRVAYYLQNGNLKYFEANYWAQVVNVKNSAILLLFTFLVSGRNENSMQMVQFISYIVATFTVYGISRRIGLDKVLSLLTSLIFSLFVEVLLEATTSQNDLLITAYVGIAVYFLLAYKENNSLKYVLFSIISIAVGIGVKASFLTIMPSLCFISLFTLFSKRLSKRQVSIIISSILIATVVLILPSGYFENYLLFNNPIGTPEIFAHSFNDKPLSYKLTFGSANIYRYGLEFLSFDGLPEKTPFIELQSVLRFLPINLIKVLGNHFLDDSKIPTLAASLPMRKTMHCEDTAYLGVLGFGLLWIAIFMLSFNLVKNPSGRLLAFAAIIFFVVQSYSGPYDAYRGRHFMYFTPFATPTIGCFIKEFAHKKSLKIYLVIILFVGYLSAIGAVNARHSENFSHFVHSGFKPNRLDLFGPRANIYKKYEDLVPSNAIVAVSFPEDEWEYLLFGPKLTRTIIPIRPFTGKYVPIPSNAHYLIFKTPDNNNKIMNSDILLGTDGSEGLYFLRKLKI